jgi:hypothetical protein
MGDHACMAYDLTKDKLDPAEDPKSIAEFIAELSEITQRRMRERAEDREDAERTILGSPAVQAEVRAMDHVPAAPRQVANSTMDLERAIAARVVAWYQAGAVVHPDQLAFEIVADVRRADWREPPRRQPDNMSVEEWKRRQTNRLPPERVALHANAARNAIRKAKVKDSDD